LQHKTAKRAHIKGPTIYLVAVIFAATILPGALAYYLARVRFRVLIACLYIVAIGYLIHLPIARQAGGAGEHAAEDIFIAIILIPSIIAAIISWSVGTMLYYARHPKPSKQNWTSERFD
jgi:predicted membrane channel-forming protein YqfA (hemolysin III family)